MAEKMLTRIGGPAAAGPAAKDPGAGDGNTFEQAAAALGRAIGVPTASQGAFKAGLRAAVFALYREYDGEDMPAPKRKADPGY